jgi:hypothetical protein
MELLSINLRKKQITLAHGRHPAPLREGIHLLCILFGGVHELGYIAADRTPADTQLAGQGRLAGRVVEHGGELLGLADALVELA